MDKPLVLRLVLNSQNKKVAEPTYTLYTKAYYNSEIGYQVVTGGGSIEASPVVIDSVSQPSTGRII